MDLKVRIVHFAANTKLMPLSKAVHQWGMAKTTPQRALCCITNTVMMCLDMQVLSTWLLKHFKSSLRLALHLRDRFSARTAAIDINTRAKGKAEHTSRFGNSFERLSKMPMMPSIKPTGTEISHGFFFANLNKNSPCSLADQALPGPAQRKLMRSLSASKYLQITQRRAHDLNWPRFQIRESPNYS